MIGPLIRAALVAWTYDADSSPQHRAESNSTFALTMVGARCVTERDTD